MREQFEEVFKAILNSAMKELAASKSVSTNSLRLYGAVVDRLIRMDIKYRVDVIKGMYYVYLV